MYKKQTTPPKKPTPHTYYIAGYVSKDLALAVQNQCTKSGQTRSMILREALSQYFGIKSAQD